MFKDNVAMVAFTTGLKKRKNKDLVISLYLNPPKDFNSTMSRAKDYMLADKALNFSDDEDQKLPMQAAQENDGRRTTEQAITHMEILPPSTEVYTLLNSPCFEVLDYVKE